MTLTGIIIFLSIISIIFLSLDIYLIKKISKILSIRNVDKRFIIGLWSLSILFFVIWIILTIYRFSVPLSNNLSITLYKIVSIWYLPKVLIILFLLPYDILKQMYLFLKKLISKNKAELVKENKSRRIFIQNTTLGLGAIPFALAFKGAVFQVDNIETRKVTIELDNLPLVFEELNLVQISDLHFGSFPDNSIIRELIVKIKSLKPDILFITGDFVNFSPDELSLGIDFFNDIKPTFGNFACLGNHDHYMSEENHQKLIKLIKENNIDLLINENRTININGSKLNIIGIDNDGRRQSFANYKKAFDGVKNYNLNILLSHDPINWEENVMNNTNTHITLSGHTHGGQIAFNILGNVLSPAALVYKYYDGLYSKNGKYLYVNRGIGTSGPPIRLTTRPEITLIRLKNRENFAKI